jgi:MraZ protein
MISFIGEYESTIDTKGRFLLPGGVKKQLPGEENATFVINRGFEKCLTLFPIQSWKPIFKEISQLNDFDPKVREFRRYFLNGATQVELDSAGRLLLPKNLLEHASLEKDIVIVSAVNKLEIWDKIKYQQFFDSFSPEAFSKLANEVMNKNMNDLFNGRSN